MKGYLDIEDDLIQCPIRIKQTHYKWCLNCLFYEGAFFDMLVCRLVEKMVEG